jgi:hypothetical protein
MGNRATELNPEIWMHFQRPLDLFCLGWDIVSFVWDSLVLSPGRLWGPPSLLFSGYSGAFLKQPGCEADHLAQSSSEVENGWSNSFTLLYAFIVCTGTLPLLIVSSNQVRVGDLKWFILISI